MRVTYENQPEDFFALLHALNWRERLAGYTQIAGLIHYVWPVLLVLAVLQEWFFLQSLLVLLGIFLLYYTYAYLRNWWKLPHNVFVIPGEQEIRLTDDYLEAVTKRGSSRRRWKYISKVVDLPDHIVIYVQTRRYLAIPKKYFDSSEQSEAFFAQVKQLHNAAQDQPLPPLEWETFRHDFGFDHLQLIKYLKWEIDPKLSARVDTLGADQDGTKSVPTALGLFGQTIMPSFVVLFLFFLKATYSENGQFFLHSLFYTLLVLAILFAFIFGMQLHTYRQYRKCLAQQSKMIRPNQIWFYPEGIGTVTEEGCSFHYWGLVGPVENDREALVILDIPPFVYAIVPKTCFASSEEEDVIRERMQECHDIAHDVYEETILAETDEVIVADLVDNPFRSPPTKPT